jgi:hypothetical protein
MIILDVLDYVKKCVEKHVENTQKKDGNLIVYVDCKTNKRYGFVQIEGIIYIPNTQDIPFNGVFMRSPDVVDGWETFSEVGVEINFVKKIIVRQPGKVGLYFYIDNEVLDDSVNLEGSEVYGDCKIGKSSHVDVWDERYEKIYKKPYDYYPRGRVVYKYKEAKFIVYKDKCIGERGLSQILKAFDIQHNKNVAIETDEHYVCKTCNTDYFE